MSIGNEFPNGRVAAKRKSCRSPDDRMGFRLATPEESLQIGDDDLATAGVFIRIVAGTLASSSAAASGSSPRTMAAPASSSARQPSRRDTFGRERPSAAPVMGWSTSSWLAARVDRTSAGSTHHRRPAWIPQGSTLNKRQEKTGTSPVPDTLPTYRRRISRHRACRHHVDAR